MGRTRHAPGRHAGRARPGGRRRGRGRAPRALRLRQGRIVTVCASALRMQLLLLDPRTLRELARYDLPRRPSTRTLSFRRITSDTSGGVYFYLDHRDRAVLGTAARRIEVVAHDGAAFHL